MPEIAQNEARLKIALAAHGRTDVALTAKDITWSQFCSRLSIPKVGDKDGSYYVRGGDLVEPKRADENLRQADVAVLDGDSSFDPETGEIHPGAPPLDQTVAALSDLGIAFFAHTTHSHDATTGTWKYRILVPAKMQSPAELDAVVSYLIDQLHTRGVYITDVPENRRWSQPWYLPRVGSQDDVASFRYHRQEGRALDVSKAVQWLADRKARLAQERKLASAPPPAPPAFTPDAPSVIEAFNGTHGLDYVRRTLEANGYVFRYRDANGPGGEAYRYVRPGSTTGTAGVVVMKGARGDWCVFSHHGIEDPLSSKFTDPFDLYATFHHNGDRKAAARALTADRPKEPTIAERIAAKAAEADKSGARLTPDLPELPATPTPRIRLVMAGELVDEPVTWLIDGLLPAKGFAALYGKPGSYKSFGALYIAGMVALGREAFGRDTSKGDVVYLAGEGGAGLKRRWDALRKQHSLPEETPIAFVKAQLNLRSTMDDAEALVAAVRAKGLKPKLLTIDTLARAFGGGNENSSEDMGAFIAICSYIMHALDCAILIVHHSGKDEARGQRGHSSLLGAVDAELEVTKLSSDDSPERIGRLKITKQKDGEDGVEIGYRMVTVQLSDLNPDATSLALEPLEAVPTPAQRGPKIEGRTRLGLDTLKEAISNHGSYVTSNHIPRQAKCVQTETWRTYFYAAFSADTANAKRVAFQYVREKMQAMGLAGVHTENWWLVQGDE